MITDVHPRRVQRIVERAFPSIDLKVGKCGFKASLNPPTEVRYVKPDAELGPKCRVHGVKEPTL